MQTVLMPAVSVASSVPGRMRLKLPPGDWSGRELTLKETMHSISGVTDLRWTKITNSLVVYYDHQRTSSEEILDECQRALVPLVVSNTSILAVPVRAAAAAVQPEGYAATGKESNGKESNSGNGEKPPSTTSSNSISLGTWLLGVSLVIVGTVLFIIPFVPGLPLLIAGLTLLQLT